MSGSKRIVVGLGPVGYSNRPENGSGWQKRFGTFLTFVHDGYILDICASLCSSRFASAVVS